MSRIKNYIFLRTEDLDGNSRLHIIGPDSRLSPGMPTLDELNESMERFFEQLLGDLESKKLS